MNDEQNVSRMALSSSINEELERGYKKHGSSPWSRHEFYGVLLEEVDELWDVIKRDGCQCDVNQECVQIAAMVFRYMETSL